jgi:hypothetical protein
LEKGKKMRLDMILIATSAVLMFGCASSKQKEADSTPVPVSAPAPSVAPVSPTGGESAKSTITCTANQDKRTMEIENSKPMGCKLKYSKFSETDPVAWSFKGLTHCKSVQNQIRGTLEAAGFKCEGQ